MLMLMSVSFVMTIVFLLLSHPITMGLVILIQTFIISLMTGVLIKNFWFSYILFLTMIGGMLVLFLYMTNVASNEKFNFSYMIMLFLIVCYFLIMFSLVLNNFYKMNINNSYMLSNNHFLHMITKFYNFPFNMVFILIMIYLLLTLIMSVKMTLSNEGPLRQKY